MCGITGYYSFNKPISKFEFEKFTNSLSHRGPDGFGNYFHSNNTIALGHRRLSIIDTTEAASQPMHSEDEKYTIVFNGEVFNYIEIKKELHAKGISFHTKSDTEVVLKAYIHYGVECLNKFNGMWALAILNNETGELFAARDRFGIKPFYYYLDNEKIILASETIAFKELDNIDLSYNSLNIKHELATCTYLEGHNKTIYNNIFSLPSGSYFKINKTLDFKIVKWWDTKINKVEVPKTFKEQVDVFKELFFSSINLRLRSDVSIGTALSGGVDSSAVYCSLNKLSNQNNQIPENFLKAYVATFPNTKNDETEYARIIINQYNNPYKLIELDLTNLPYQIEKNTQNIGVITGTPLLPIYNLYKQMKNDGTTVSLDGHGADELLYGYTWLVLSAQHQAVLNRNKLQTEQLTNCYLNLFEPESRIYINNHLKKYDPWIKHIIKKSINKKSTQILANSWLDFKMESSEQLSAENFLYQNFHESYLPTILRNFDRASMNAGVEVRMPFMDYRLVSFLFSLPLESKLGNGYTKLVLREAMKDIVPDEIRLRTYKLGINAPVYNWFNNELKSWVQDTVSTKKFTEMPYFNGKTIQSEILNAYKVGELSPHLCNKLWSYLSAHLIL